MDDVDIELLLLGAEKIFRIRWTPSVGLAGQLGGQAHGLGTIGYGMHATVDLTSFFFWDSPPEELLWLAKNTELMMLKALFVMIKPVALVYKSIVLKNTKWKFCDDFGFRSPVVRKIL